MCGQRLFLGLEFTGVVFGGHDLLVRFGGLGLGDLEPGSEVAPLQFLEPQVLLVGVLLCREQRSLGGPGGFGHVHRCLSRGGGCLALLELGSHKRELEVGFFPGLLSLDGAALRVLVALDRGLPEL